ncbi:MAG: hypothetical protein EOO41_04355, partial [Methanobacteriota archaeon]
MVNSTATGLPSGHALLHVLGHTNATASVLVRNVRVDAVAWGAAQPPAAAAACAALVCASSIANLTVHSLRVTVSNATQAGAVDDVQHLLPLPSVLNVSAASNVDIDSVEAHGPAATDLQVSALWDAAATNAAASVLIARSVLALTVRTLHVEAARIGFGVLMTGVAQARLQSVAMRAVHADGVVAAFPVPQNSSSSLDSLSAGLVTMSISDVSVADSVVTSSFSSVQPLGFAAASVRGLLLHVMPAASAPPSGVALHPLVDLEVTNLVMERTRAIRWSQPLWSPCTPRASGAAPTGDDALDSAWLAMTSPVARILVQGVSLNLTGVRVHEQADTLMRVDVMRANATIVDMASVVLSDVIAWAGSARFPTAGAANDTSADAIPPVVSYTRLLVATQVVDAPSAYTMLSSPVALIL